jgi:hypothetical protein
MTEKQNIPESNIKELREGNEYSILITCPQYPEGIVLNGKPESNLLLEMVSENEDSPKKYLPTSEELLSKKKKYQSWIDSRSIILSEFESGGGDLNSLFLYYQKIMDINDRKIEELVEERDKAYKEFFNTFLEGQSDIPYLKRIIRNLYSIEVLE